MNASLLKHLKERTNDDLSCIDDHTHKCVIQVRAADAVFVLEFQNISMPESVTQTFGKPRKMTSHENSVASEFLSEFLRGAISETLLEDELNVTVAKKIMRALGHDDFFKHIVLAKRLINANSAESMALLISESIGIDESDPKGLIKGIVGQINFLLNDMMAEKR